MVARCLWYLFFFAGGLDGFLFLHLGLSDAGEGAEEEGPAPLAGKTLSPVFAGGACEPGAFAPGGFAPEGFAPWDLVPEGLVPWDCPLELDVFPPDAGTCTVEEVVKMSFWAPEIV